MFSPGVLTTQLVLVAPVGGGLSFLAVFPQEGHGSLEILVWLQAKERIYQSGQGPEHYLGQFSSLALTR